MFPDPSPDSTSAVPSITALLTALARPECYSHHPAQVEVVQTHISVVFLAGEVVYKLKKPVRFSFLDYSTLALRHHYCQEEVRLNRRLAPTVYLEVVPVLQNGAEYRVGEGIIPPDAIVVDYLVKMRRLPAERMLDSLVTQGRVSQTDMDTLAGRLVSFHAAATPELAAVYGAPETIWQALADNFQETTPCIGQTLSQKQYDFIQEFSRRFFTGHLGLFRQRIAQGRVREGHGDLRCEHVCFLDDGIAIFDCIEFSPSLRTCDVASELAFLAMDLELHEAPALSVELIHAYSAQTQDTDLLRLLPFYQCYRAYVRGKVESLKSREPEVSPEERQRARVQACRAFRLAYRYAGGSTSPALVIVCGRIGTGKSTVARLLSERTGFSVFNSDIERKRLAGLAATTRASAEHRAGIYTEVFTRRTYAVLRIQAERELRAGHSVIVDATCKQREERRAFRELGERLGVQVLFIECRASLTVVEHRLREREQKGDSVSDATWAIALKEQVDFPVFDDIPDRSHLVIDTGTKGALEAALAMIEEDLACSLP